ncbi:MAG: hypothetical protein B1H13_13500 [Desulfobacteraceae bacterium 4484_190.3]|nr:MAG: hypothetical protein B1H13_13500 [Desulfobacteraceae bacterium 4484_190.3]
MSKKVINFWQDHSSNFLKMAFSHDRRESIENPDGYGKRTGDCGDTVEFFLTIFGGRIKSVSFKTNGCINTNACARTGTVLNWQQVPFIWLMAMSHFHNCAR